MENQELYHYGVPGMRWGVIRSRSGSGSKKPSTIRQKLEARSKEKKKKKAAKKAASMPVKKKSISEMSDAELREKINRLQMEKTYKSLMSESDTSKRNRGQALVLDILEKSARDVGTQAATYFMGQKINEVFKNPNIVQQKGKKDDKK